MATNSAGTDAREFTTQQVHYLRRAFSANNAGQSLSMGKIPGNAVAVDAYAVVKTAFNGGGNINMGTGADADGYMAGTVVTATGVKRDSELATSDDVTPIVDTEVFLAVANTAVMTAGKGYAIFEFIPSNDK